MDIAPLRGRVAREMEMARQARAAGREGRARVCARRAAGLAAMHYLEKTARPERARNALGALRRLSEMEDLPPPLRQAASRLITRVTEVHELPHEEDALVDARVVIVECLGEESLHA